MLQRFDADKLSVNSFKILSENIAVPEFFERESIKEFHSTNNLGISFNLEAKLIRAEFVIDINTESGSEVEAQAQYKFVLIYQYDAIEELAVLDGEDLRVDAQLGFAISAITYSTIRGVLLIKLSETVFQDFILPVIKPSLPNE